MTDLFEHDHGRRTAHVTGRSHPPRNWDEPERHSSVDVQHVHPGSQLLTTWRNYLKLTQQLPEIVPELPPEHFQAEDLEAINGWLEWKCLSQTAALASARHPVRGRDACSHVHNRALSG